MSLSPGARLIRSTLIFFAAGAALVSCSAFERKNIAEYQIDAGSVKLSVISVAPWEEVVGDLSPDFSLKADDAVAKVLTTNAAFRRQTLRQLLASFGISSLGPTPEKTTQTVTEGEKVTTTLTEKAQADSVGGPILGNLAGLPEKLPDLALTGELGNEPIITYKAATALYQEVKLLNQYLEHAVIPEGYQPYLVRLQLAVLPNRRNQPFDIFSDLQFLPGSEILDTEIDSNYKITEISPDNLYDIDIFEKKIEGFERRLDRSKSYEERVDILYEMTDLTGDFTHRLIRNGINTGQDYRHQIKLSDRFRKKYPAPLDVEWKSKIQEKISKIIREVDDPELKELKRELEEAISSSLGNNSRNQEIEIDEIESSAGQLGGLNDVRERLQQIRKLLENADVVEPTFADFAASIPKVIPLLVTDSLETAAQSEVVQIARQLSLLGAGTAGGTPFRGQVQSLLNDLQEAQTRDLNSLQSISQLNDNSVRLRLGARYDGNNKFEMTARTHNITLLVNVPNAVAALDHPRDRRLRVLAINKMRDARTGRLLEDGRQSSRELDTALDDLSGYELTDHRIEKGRYCLGKNGDDGREALKSNKRIMKKVLNRFVFYGEYIKFSQAVSCMTGKGPEDPMSLRDQRLLWASLTALTTAIPVDRIDIDLPQSKDPSDDPIDAIFITADDTVEPSSNTPGGKCDDFRFANGVMTDDNKKTLVRLPMRRGLSSSKLELALQVPGTSYHHEFAAEKIEFEGALLKATFPSLAAFRQNHRKTPHVKARLKAKIKRNQWPPENEIMESCDTAYIDVFLLTEKAEKPTYKISVGWDDPDHCLMPRLNAFTELGLRLDWADKQERDIAVRLEKAVLAIDTPPPPEPGDKWKRSGPKLALGTNISPGDITLKLDHLTPGENFVLKFGPNKDGKLDETDFKAFELKVCTQPVKATQASTEGSSVEPPPNPKDTAREATSAADSARDGDEPDEIQVSGGCGPIKGSMDLGDHPTVVLMRHADKEGTDADAPLSRNGREHAELVALALSGSELGPLEWTTSSPDLDRTCETAKVLSGGSNCNEPESPNTLNDMFNGPSEGKRYGIVFSTTAITGDLEKLLGDEPDLACGEAAIFAKEQEKTKCLYRILPHEWPGADASDIRGLIMDKYVDWGKQSRKDDNRYWLSDQCSGNAQEARS